MTAFRILNQSPVYFDLAGNLAAGGTLKFYASGTTTPKDVYADPDKAVNNGSTVDIGTDGRATVDVWGDGTYRVRLYDVDDTLVSEADDVEIPGGTGTAIPALESGKFLTNDGAIMSWSSILQPPDPTGSADKILSTDGSNFVWIAKPADGAAGADPDITVSSTTMRIGVGADTPKWLFQSGSATATASGTRSASVAVTFPTAFDTLLIVIPTQTHGGTTSWGIALAQTLTSHSTTGFTVMFTVNDSSQSSSWDINSDITFDWVAIGLKTVL